MIKDENKTNNPQSYFVKEPNQMEKKDMLKGRSRQSAQPLKLEYIWPNNLAMSTIILKSKIKKEHKKALHIEKTQYWQNAEEIQTQKG